MTEDVSSASESDLDRGYQTDNTSPPESDMMVDDGSSEEVEEFRDREYPQLRGKVYLDHGGTTVGIIHPGHLLNLVIRETDNGHLALRQIFNGGVLARHD